MKRPLPVTILGGLFIVAGLTGLVYHLSEGPLDRGMILISMVRILAIVGGVFLLLGHNWARWLMLAWLAFHVRAHAVGAIVRPHRAPDLGDAEVGGRALPRRTGA